MRLTKQQFRQYLEEHPDEVHTTRDPNSCPIAHAIQVLNPRATNVWVSPWSIDWHIGEGRKNHSIETAEWQQAFIREVDHQGRTITGRGALAVLDGCSSAA
jgi:hypothetical protein